MTRAEVLTAFAQVASLFAAQQAQIEQLRNEIATLKNANLAIFGEQQVIEQLMDAGCDFENVEVSMSLEEQTSELQEETSESSDNSNDTMANVRDLAGGVEGLASFIASLNIKGAANLSTMNKAAKRLKETSRNQVRTRSRGRVSIKFGQVSPRIAPRVAVQDVVTVAPIAPVQALVDGAVGSQPTAQPLEEE